MNFCDAGTLKWGIEEGEIIADTAFGAGQDADHIFIETADVVAGKRIQDREVAPCGLISRRGGAEGDVVGAFLVRSEASDVATQ